MTRAHYSRALLGTTSLIVVALALSGARQAQAQDTTISSLVTTGTAWDGTLAPASNFTITPTGTIDTSGAYALTVIGSTGVALGTFANSGLVINSNATGSAINVGTVTVSQFTNEAGSTISAISRGVLVGATGTIGALTNTGRIGGATGLSSSGSIGSIANTGTIYGSERGIYQAPGGQIGTITNDGVIEAGASGSGAAGGIANGGNIVSVVNNGTILSNHSSGIGNNQSTSSIGTLVNNGVLGGVTSGIYNKGTFTQIINAGTITGPAAGIWNEAGKITSLTNSGTISGGTKAINLTGGTIGALSNSGTISGPVAVAISSGANLTSIANSGVIAGNIANGSANALTISGGTGLTFGTLTGSTLTNKGSIVNTLSNLVFSGGNLLLNDDINATGRTVSNTGAKLRLNSTITVAGAFSQTAGSLLIDPTAGGIAATGAVDVSGGTVVASFTSTGNYLAGTYTLLSGSSLNLTGSTVTINNVTGLDRSSSTVANSLQLTVQNDYVGGTLSTLTNAAALTSANTGLYVATTGRIGTMSNTGTLGGAQFGVNNRGTIGTLSNAGVITNANFTALWNQGSIGQLINTGTITNSSWAILNSGTLSTLTNSGVIAGAGNAVQNNGVITVVDNSGTMSGGSNALAGNFATIINSGVIKGNVNGNGGTIGTIIGGSNGTVGTFTGATNGTQGTIGISSNLTFASGALLLNDSVVAKNVASSSVTASNTGADITIATIVNVDAKFSQSAGSLNLGSAGKLVVTQTASFTGGTVTASLTDLSAAATYLVGTTGKTLVEGGAGSSYSGATVNVSTNVNGLASSGATSGNNLVLAYGNDYVGDTQVSISNSGTISGVNFPLYVANSGSIGTFVNSGSLIGSLNGATNNGSIGSLTNSGLIQGGEKGFGNQSTVTEITNSATGTIRGGTAAGLQNDTSMGTLTNAGLITSGSAGVANYGTLGAIINTGSISGGPQAIYLDGNSTVTSVTNSGTIAAGQTGVQVGGTLTALTNSGFIGGSNALNIAGTLGTLVNQAGGTIKGDNAVYLSGSLGGLANSGVIAGSITNTSASALTITGGSGTVTGTLTGANLSSKGTIVNTQSNLTFAGNLSVNDNINVGTNTLTNSGGALSFGSIVSVTGNLAQTTGSLTLNGTGKLVVSLAASITGGTIVANALSSTGNYLHGSTAGTLVAGGVGSNYTGVTVALGSAATGLSASGTTSGTNLLLQANNDYVGGTLVSVTNGDTITGVGSALYVAATGKITTYANSGGLFGLTTAAVNHGTITTLSNSGTISGVASGLANMAGGSIATVSNLGAISGGIGDFGIDNAGVIGALINAQGGGSNAALTFTGALPGSYLEYVFGTDHYGQMQVTGGTGTIGDFDIASGSALTFGTTYAAVLSGVTTVEGETSTVSGTFSLGLDHYDWNLVNSGSDVWDLVIASLFTAPDADDTAAVGQPVMAANFAQQFDGSVVLSQLSQLRLADGLGSSGAEPDANPSLRISSMGSAAPVGNAFAILRGAKADYTAPDGGEAFGLSSSGLTFGTGRYLDNADANFGVFGSVSRTSSTGDTASDAVDTKGIGLFGDKELGGGFLLEGYLAYYKNAHDMTRVSDGDLYTASPDGTSINGFARVSFGGLKMPTAMLLSPYVEMSYTRQSTDAYDESGDGGAAIHVDADSTSNTTTAIGAVFAASVPVGDGMTLSPMIDAAWVHASNNGARSLTTSFVGGVDTFDTAIAGSDQDYGRIKASVGLQMNEKFNLSLGYSTQIENEDLDNLGEVRLEARLKF